MEGNGLTTETPLSTSTLPETSTTENNGVMEVYIFVVGSGDRARSKKTEIVSLTEGDSIPDCLNALSDHPNQLFHATGGALPDAGYLPHTCGSYYSPLDECWVYKPSEDTWTKASTIPRTIDNAASAFHPAWGIIMSGIHGQYAEVITTKDAEYFEELEPLPDYSVNYCVAAIDENTIFVTGLGWNDDESFKYDRDKKEWISLPNMPTGRYFLGCGVVRDGSGKIEVIVFGGIDTEYNEKLDLVEIFDIEENSWRTASNPFPTEITSPSVAQHDNMFYVVGGIDDGDNRLDTIYRYEATDESWQLMPNRMKFGRYEATSMMVNASIFPSCD